MMGSGCAEVEREANACDGISPARRRLTRGRCRKNPRNGIVLRYGDFMSEFLDVRRSSKVVGRYDLKFYRDLQFANMRVVTRAVSSAPLRAATRARDTRRRRCGRPRHP